MKVMLLLIGASSEKVAVASVQMERPVKVTRGHRALYFVVLPRQAPFGSLVTPYFCFVYNILFIFSAICTAPIPAASYSASAVPESWYSRTPSMANFSISNFFSVINRAT